MLTAPREIPVKEDSIIISEEYFNKRDSASIDYSDVQFDYIFENDYQEQTMNRMLNRLSEQYIGGDER